MYYYRKLKVKIYKDIIKYNKSKHAPSKTAIFKYMNYFRFDYYKKLNNKQKEIICDLAKTKTTKEVEEIIISNISNFKWEWDNIFWRKTYSEKFITIAKPYFYDPDEDVYYQKLSKEYIIKNINEENFGLYLYHQKVPFCKFKEIASNIGFDVHTWFLKRQDFYSKYITKLITNIENKKEVYFMGRKQLTGDKLEFLEMVAKQVFGNIEYFLLQLIV